MSDFVIDNPTAVAFEVSAETRTIRGLAVPYGVAASSDGQSWMFTKGTLVGSSVKLLASHDWSQAIGTVVLEDTDAGLMMVAKVARGAEGDRFLSLAEDGVYDGLSIGLSSDVKATLRAGVQHVKSGTVREVSLTPIPAFTSARVTSVAASAAPKEGTSMEKNETPAVEDPKGLAFSETISAAIAAGFASIGNPQGEGPEVVGAGHTLEVTEAAAYRFDGIRAEHDFSGDLIAFGRDHDAEAGARAMAFMSAEFGPSFVASGNVTALNPARPRPDMYVDERKFTTPFYDALYRGAITDMTPFIVPKFNASAGTVADHVEGVEPADGTFSATSQTITPTAVSGRVPITREVWDQGGNPQVSALIWNKMKYEYFRSLEA